MTFWWTRRELNILKKRSCSSIQSSIGWCRLVGAIWSTERVILSRLLSSARFWPCKVFISMSGIFLRIICLRPSSYALCEGWVSIGLHRIRMFEFSWDEPLEPFLKGFLLYRPALVYTEPSCLLSSTSVTAGASLIEIDCIMLCRMLGSGTDMIPPLSRGSKVL